jgi:hypothetical protein
MHIWLMFIHLPISRSFSKSLEVQIGIVIFLQLIRVIIVDGLRNSADDVVPVVVGGRRANEGERVSEEQLKVDEIGEFVTGHKTVRITRSTSTGNTTNAMNKELGSKGRKIFSS